MRIQRTIILFVSLILIVVLLPLSTVSASEEALFELSSIRGNIGDTIQVMLSIKNNPGITALSVSIGYDSDYLKLISVENGALFSDSVSTGKIENNPITISWYATDSGNKTNNGTLAILSFSILEGATDSEIVISYNPENVFDNELQNKAFSVKNGEVFVGEEPTEPTENNTFILGDADGDGGITILDATVIQRYLAAFTVPKPEYVVKCGDVNGDGVDIIDATCIQRYLAAYTISYEIGKPIKE